MKKTARFNFFVKLTILVVICFCAVNIIRLRNDLNHLKDQEQEYIEEKARYEEEIHRLHEEYNRPMDDEYIMRIAREKLNYYLPDEIVFFNDR